ncbi:hypothetical protein C7212DRAFT_366524 [Tuber magnatum]|uniref:GPI anchored protein n=1 Tax=Tuber magnatum TaxID=42249 RepID=A0A317SFG0_9PEZI|nr:hypothetical protein C7212DRAFT_366524 [Tuber magnatum]
MKVTQLLLLGASIGVATASEKFEPNLKPINRRDAIPIPDVFMNAIQAVPVLRKRDLDELIHPASTLGGVVKRSFLGPRQWGCGAVGQISCPSSGSTPTPTRPPTSAGLSTSTGSTTFRLPTSHTKPSPICPTGYSPCSGSNTCCPAGVKCLPDKKCDSKCSATDVRCGTGCCKKGFTCNTSTSLCAGTGSGDVNDSDDSSSDSSSSRSIPNRPTISATTPRGPSAETGVGTSENTGNGGSGSSKSSGSSGGSSDGSSGGGSDGSSGGSFGGSSGGSSSGGVSLSGPRLVAGMGMAGAVALVGIALL